MEWAAENIRKANIGVKMVYEWVDEPTADLTEVGLALSEREDIQSVIGCNVADKTQKLAFALARKKENIKPLFTFSTSQELPRISILFKSLSSCLHGVQFRRRHKASGARYQFGGNLLRYCVFFSVPLHHITYKKERKQ